MSKDVIITCLGSSDESDEVRILRWLKDQGTRVKMGDVRLQLETDKVNVESESPEDGVLQAQEGEFVGFGSVIAVIEKQI